MRSPSSPTPTTAPSRRAKRAEGRQVPMRVRVVVPMYPPYSLVGSWLTTHEFMRDLVAHGHRVDVTAYQSRYATTPGDRVTLVNTSADKGGVLFWSLAERLPDVPFMAVVGGYGRQILWSGHPNVVIQRHSPNVTTEVYGRTRVLLLPSIV